MKYEQEAKELVEALKLLANRPGNMDNLESYLSYHFGEWLEKYANSPAAMVGEMKSFAEMEV
jgi:hypothetical protein